MWIFSNDLTEDPNKTGTWSHQEPKDSYEVAPGVAWESRNDVSCQIYWPSGRAGHAVAYDKKRNGMWLFGVIHHIFRTCPVTPLGVITAPNLSRGRVLFHIPHTHTFLPICGSSIWQLVFGPRNDRVSFLFRQ